MNIEELQVDIDYLGQRYLDTGQVMSYELRAVVEAARLVADPNQMIELLVPVMVDIQPLYESSYAAPREAASKVLAALGITSPRDTE